MYFMFVVADSRRMVRSKKFFESEIPHSIRRVINEVIKNLSSLSGHWYERLIDGGAERRQLYLNFPIDLPTTQQPPALASHPIFSKSVDFTASDQIPT